MKIKLTIIYLIIVSCLVPFQLSESSNLNLSSEIISLSPGINPEYYYRMDSRLAKDGKFTMVFQLLEISLSPVNFSYEISSNVNVIDNDDITISTDNTVNATLYPNDIINIKHEIINCVGDVFMAVPIYFTTILNNTAEIEFDFIIEEFGEEYCPQLGGNFPQYLANFGNVMIFILLILSFIIIKAIYGRLSRNKSVDY